MAPAPAAVKARRVVVALDASAPGKAALEAAAELAARLDAELVAVFVEDIDLLHFAGLPFAHEIGFPSAIRRSIDAPAMERRMRLLADEARRSVALIAERTPFKWTFEVTRGSLPEQLLESAAEAELIIAALAGSEQAALQLAEMCKQSGSSSLLWARTRRELEELLRELRRREE